MLFGNGQLLQSQKLSIALASRSAAAGLLLANYSRVTTYVSLESAHIYVYTHAHIYLYRIYQRSLCHHDDV